MLQTALTFVIVYGHVLGLYLSTDIAHPSRSMKQVKQSCREFAFDSVENVYSQEMG